MSKNNENKLVPEFRFPDYLKHKDWSLDRLGNIYYFITTNSFSRDDLNYLNGEVKNIHYGDIHTKFSTLFDISKENVPFINESIPLEKFKKENYCKEGDVIFADASEDLSDVGKSIEVFSLNNEKLLSGLHTLLARQLKSKLTIGFGGYLFLNHKIRKQIQRESQGAKVFGISATRLSNINIFYPEEKEEQQKIASCLSSLDEVITAESQKLDVLKEHKKGLLQNLFPQEGEKVPKMRFKEFKGEWEEKKLGEIGNFIGGGTPSKNNESFWDGDIPWISSSDIDEESIYSVSISRFISDEALKSSATKMVPANSILLVSRVGVGKLAVTEKQLCTSQDFTNFTPKDDDLIFVAYFLKNCKVSLLGFSQGMAIKGFTKDDISNMVVKIPSKPEQQKIAFCLSSLDEIIQTQAEKIELLKQHKKGLLQGLFPKMND